MLNRIIPITLFLVTAASLLHAQEKPSKPEPAKAKLPPIPATIADGKLSEFGFISHTIDCPKYFARFYGGKKRNETIEVLLPGKMEPGKRYPVLYALAPLTSAGVVHHYKMGERYHVGPLLDVREQGLHNKHQVICIKVMAINRHKDWRGYLREVVVPYVDRTYPTIAEARGRLLLGFSKTGDDVWKLLLANPELYGKACAWDALPKWDWVKPHAELLRGKPPRLILTGGSGGTEKVEAIHKKLTEEKIPHLYHFAKRDKHIWSSGWIGDAMRLLFRGTVADNAAEKSWKDQTVLVSQEGAETVVRALAGKKVLFKNADPQLAIEWAMANALTTVVLAGQYVVNDAVDIPREDVTLIIAEGAELSLNRETEDSATTFPPHKHIVPLIWNRRNNVRLIHFGAITRQSRAPGKPGKAGKPRKAAGYKDIYGIVFDGRGRPITSGFLLVAGTIPHQELWMTSCRNIEVPLCAPSPCTETGAFVMEGCNDCKLGMMVNLDCKHKGCEGGASDGRTGEVVDMNALDSGITIERIIGERCFELIDCNASQATVGELVSVGKTEHCVTLSHGCGARTVRRRNSTPVLKFKNKAIGKSDVVLTLPPGSRPQNMRVPTATILEDYASVTLKNEVPKLPDALPCFTVKSTVEVTMKDGSKKTYTRKVTIDVRK